MNSTSSLELGSVVWNREDWPLALYSTLESFCDVNGEHVNGEPCGHLEAGAPALVLELHHNVVVPWATEPGTLPLVKVLTCGGIAGWLTANWFSQEE